MNILADATIPNLSLLSPVFNLITYTSREEIHDLLPNQAILLCRSTLNVNAALLEGSHIECVATASSGIDHIDTVYLKKHGIQLLDAKGSNAQSVAEYMLATIAFLLQHKKIRGQKAGIIGVGHVGRQVLALLHALDFEVLCYDPLREILDKNFHSCSFDELASCDLLCIHANFHKTKPYPSANLLSASFLNQLKPDATIINTARGGIVNEEALLNLSKSITYCTDVYNQEPGINPNIVSMATLCTPHIAGHSIEAKAEAVVIINRKLHQQYGLPEPELSSVPQSPSIMHFAGDWQARILRWYNPLKETVMLKEASDKTLAFLSLRKAHHRHTFK
jgi:erythronate-4-phosphate dehydrogenase